MSKKEYLDRLEQQLSDISSEERQAAIEYFTDYLEDAGPDGEQEVMEHLGSPEEVAAAVKEGLSNENEEGRFTESGYESGTEAGRYAVVKAGRNRRTAGERAYSGSTDQREKEGQNGNQSRQGQRREQASGERRYHRQDQRRGIGWLLILIGGIICIGIPLVSVLGSVFAAIIAAVAAVAIGGFAVALGLAAAGLVLLVTGIMKVSVLTGMGLMLMGGAFLCLAFAALALAAGVWMWGRVIPWAVRGFVGIFQKIFRTERRS